MTTQYQFKRTEKVEQEDPETYLFTFSPIGNTKKAEFTYYDHLTFYFKSWHRCMSKFEINPEFNANGNLHYHGFFILEDKVKWYKIVLPKMKYNGLVKISKVKHNLIDALEYCRKDSFLMREIIKKYPVPYTHLDDRVIQKPDISKNTLHDFLQEMSRVKESHTEKQKRVFIKKTHHDLDSGTLSLDESPSMCLPCIEAGRINVSK